MIRNKEERVIMMNELPNCIQVEHINKKFTRVVKADEPKKKWQKNRTTKEEFLAVNDVSFTAEKGQIYGILGPNGAGKTTLLRMLGGILTPTSGNLRVMGYDYEKDKEKAKRQIGYLSGNTKLYGRLSPRELFHIFGELYEMSREEIDKAIEEVTKVLNLEGFIDNRIENLSTGQTQRISIARCLLHSPEMYILDEPTLGLDVLSSQDIIQFMKKEREKGKIVLYSTHYMEEAESLCDQVLMLHEGRIIAEGKPRELMQAVGIDNLRDLFIYYATGEGGRS